MDALLKRDFKRLILKIALKYLYHPNEFYRFRGAEALGCLCKDKAKNYILRLFWHLSDESGAYCIGAPLGIAKIGLNNPQIFDGFKNKYVSLLDNWEVERRYVAYGIGRTADILKDAYPNPVEKLLEKLEELKDDANFVVYALFALYKLKVDVRGFENDRRIAKFYDGRTILKMEIRKLFKYFPRHFVPDC